MSRLYVRVKTGFYTHRKTARLRAKIGDDAFWVPPRLWAYAAENQPDGDMSSYSSPELAELIGCSKHATSMLQALKDAGFVDKNGHIHDWEEHNGYHQRYSDRAKTAAAARWGKPSPTPPPTETEESGKGKGETSIACGMLVASDQHGAFIKGWVDNFKEKFGVNYKVDGGKDGKATKELLKMGILVIDLLEIAKKAWGLSTFAGRQSQTIHGFRHHFNNIQVEVKNGNHKTSEKPNPRNNGIAFDPAETGRKTAEFIARKQSERKTNDAV